MDDENNIIDNDHKNQRVKKLWTIRLLIIGGAIIAFTFLVASFWEALGLTRRETMWLSLSLMVSFGINMAGLIVGIIEISKNFKRALLGIIGNSLLIIFFILLVVYSIRAFH